MLRMLRPYICLLLALWPRPALAAALPAQWHTFTAANGLAGNIVQALWEDPQGRIWFGTENGVSRYDGQRWTTFRSGVGLPDPNIWAISGDATSVWVATSSGLSRLRAERWEHFTSADGLPGDDVRAVLVASDGSVWAGTFGAGVARLRPGATRWEPLPLPAALSREAAFVQAIWQAPAGDLWFSTSGAGAIRLRGDQIEQFSFRSGSRNTVWSAGAAADSPLVWLATLRGIALIGADDQLQVLNETVQGVPLAATEVLAVAGGASGDLWFGTRAQGVLRRTAAGWERYTIDDGLGRNYVQTILADRAGRVWFGVRGGGARLLTPRPPAAADLRATVGAADAQTGTALELGAAALAASQNNLRLTFQADLAWLPPQDVSFRYWLTRSDGRAVPPERVAQSGPTAPSSATSEVLIGLAPGSYTLHVLAQSGDLHGPAFEQPFVIRRAPPIFAPASVAVLVDGQPVGAGLTLPQRLFDTQRTVELRLGTREPLAEPLRYEYQIGAGAWQPADGALARLALDPGSWQVAARAVDLDGNPSAPAALTVIVPPPLWPTLLGYLFAVLLPSTLSGVAGALVYRRWSRQQALRRAVSGYVIPYDVGPLIVGPEQYIGRRHEIDTILGKLANSSFAVYGEKRIGKTSLLLQVKARLNQRNQLGIGPRAIPVFRNIQDVPQPQFWLYLLRSIAAELPQAPPNLACLGQPASYDDLDAEQDLELIVAALRAEPDAPALIVLLLDEVDTLQRYDPLVGQRFRAFCQHTQSDLRVILAGVVAPVALSGDTSPWYNIFERLTLGPLTPADALHLIRDYNHNPYRYTAAAEQAILAHGACKPFETQWLCSEAVRAMLAARRTTVTAADVALAVAAVTGARAGEYSALWQSLSAGAQQALLSGGPLPAEANGIAASPLFRAWLTGALPAATGAGDA